jgi:energy-coupling factor transport system substrate-specific component
MSAVRTGAPVLTREPVPSKVVRALRFRPRSALALALVSTVGVIAFGWPLFADGDSALAHTKDAPLLFALLMVLLLAVLLAEIADGGIDPKAIALLGVLTAVGAALRPLGTGLTGFSPVFILIILGGRVLGRGFGFVLGALTLFASALITGGVGPWLPFQMLAAAWVGFFAGCLPRAEGRREVTIIAAYGAVSGILYGFVMNLWFWPFISGLGSGLSYDAGAAVSENLQHFVAYCLATSLGFDVPRAVGNVVLVLAVGAPLLRTLRRASRKAAFEAAVVFEDADADAPRVNDHRGPGDDDRSHDAAVAR